MTLPESVDVGALLEAGWQPTPFTEFVLKIHSRCNLACDYCYVYTMADQSWRGQPVHMSARTLGHALARASEHARTHDLRAIRVILHGGEPLLASRDTLCQTVSLLRGGAFDGVSVTLSLQTNGTLLTARKLQLLDRLGIEVGVSLDGDVLDNDRHRKLPSGTGSHAAVVAGLGLLASPPYRQLFRGLLCTIDLQSDPLSTYACLVQFGPPAVDFLLPHRNWASPPAGGRSAAPYADWLIPVFDQWYDEPAPATQIRLFAEIMNLLLGGRSKVEGLGLEPLQTVIVETDGAIQQSDFLKSAYPGAPDTGLRVQDHTFDAVLISPAIAGRQLGASALSATCRLCPVHRICGGGQYAHRYRPDFGFGNPTVYCADLFRLIRHIESRLRKDVKNMRNSCLSVTA